MRISIHGASGLLLTLIGIGGCASQPTVPVANPVAEELRAGAHQLVQASQACRKDAAAYRERHQAAAHCPRGLVQIGLNSRHYDECAAAIFAAVPACKQWDDKYRMMAGADGVIPEPMPPGIALMETNELNLVAGLAADDSAADDSRTGD